MPETPKTRLPDQEVHQKHDVGPAASEPVEDSPPYLPCVPDRERLARFAREPEAGPQVLFFSGGTALRDLSRCIAHYTHNSVHLVTPFDSGGSSAKIRDAFSMISVGDLRNRLMALASSETQGSSEVYRLFNTRLPFDGEQAVMRRQLRGLIEGTDPLVVVLPRTLRTVICKYLGFFLEKMPVGFDLRNASLGNLILTGGYLNNRGNIDAVIDLFSMLVEAKGLVRPTVCADLHLAAELKDATMMYGQHRITDKEKPLSVPVSRLYLTKTHRPLGDDGPREVEKTEVAADDHTLELILGADLVVFPMGSFYTSVIANLLPQGIGRAIAKATCPKVYIPNWGTDTEQLGLQVSEAVSVLLEQLRVDAPNSKVSELIDFVVVDTQNGDYPGGLDVDAVRELGVQVIDTPLIHRGGGDGRAGRTGQIDAHILSDILVSLTSP